MIGLFAGRKRLQQYLDERNQAEEELRNSSNALEAVNKTLNLANQEPADHRDHLWKDWCMKEPSRLPKRVISLLNLFCRAGWMNL